MEPTFYDDPVAFLTAAGDHLAAEPVLGTVVASVTQRWAEGREVGRGFPVWWAIVRDAGAVVGVAMRTAPFVPHPLFLLPMPDAAATALARALHARGEHPGGCNGALPAAQVCAEEVARLWGGAAETTQHTRLFECREVVPPATVPGVLRPARPEEVALCTSWYNRFGAEADEQAGRSPGSAHTDVHTEDDLRARIAVGTVWLLEDADGTVVHLTGRNPPAYGVSRIGPVYTPREHRGRGYASYVVGELTARGLAEGWRMCLFTDQANPVSNRVYERLGYRRVVDMANLTVLPATQEE